MSETHFIIQTASANMPSSCNGRYSRIGLLEVDVDRNHVSMIAERARGVHQVVETWEKLSCGGPQSAFAQAYLEALEIRDRLNRGMDMEFQIGRRQYRLEVVGFDVAITRWVGGCWAEGGSGRWNPNRWDGYKLENCEADLGEEVFAMVDQLMNEEGY